MSEQDLNTIRNAYEAFNRADIPAVLEAFDPLIEWHEPGGGRSWRTAPGQHGRAPPAVFSF